MLFNQSTLALENMDYAECISKGIHLSVLRLDKIHPVISGNKLFKLHFYLEKAEATKSAAILTFGGAYSNHLLATAYACKLKGIKCIGIVRGEKPLHLSHTLQECIHYNMQLKFISRSEYDKNDNPVFIKKLEEEFGQCLVIPEGGYDKLGVKGAALIMESIAPEVTHVCCAIGTATTVAGLITGAHSYQQIIGIPVLKGLTDMDERISFLTQKKFNPEQLQLFYQYHFGGYAKSTPELFNFMNSLYKNFLLATDFVYTAKMMYAVFDLISKNIFPSGSNIVCLHTGGLQGNQSLQKDILTF